MQTVQFPHSGPENLKKVQAKKTCEIKYFNFMKKNSDQIPFFAISKMAKKSSIELGKSSTLNIFHEN